MWEAFLHRWSRDQSRYAPIQWETVLHCNDISHWLGTYLDRSLMITGPLRDEGHLYEQGSQLLYTVVKLIIFFRCVIKEISWPNRRPEWKQVQQSKHDAEKSCNFAAGVHLQMSSVTRGNSYQHQVKGLPDYIDWSMLVIAFEGMSTQITGW